MAKQSKPRLTKAQKKAAKESRAHKTRGKRTAEQSAATEQFAYRFEGYPSESAALQMQRTIGCCRFLWNRMKADRDQAYQTSGKVIYPTPAQYKRDPDLKWLCEVDSLALANVQLNLKTAYNNFWDGLSEFPSFKKKGRCKESYTTNIASKGAKNLRLEGNMLKLPKVKESIRLKVHRPIRSGGILKSCTVTHERNGKWMFSLLYEYPKQESPAVKCDPKQILHIGLDMSLSNLFVDSDGDTPSFMKPYHKLQNKLAREQRKLSRMEKGSKNYERQRVRVAKLYSKTKNQRKDFLHKLSCQLINTYHVIGIEDLDMSAMKQALKFGKSVNDIGWGMFVSMLQYKSKRTGCHIIKVNKWFPSSKMCSKCGHVHKELKLSDRTYICPKCGHVMNRDYQAAINIDVEAMKIFTETIFRTA